MMRKAMLGAMVLLVAGGMTFGARSSGMWLHVHVDEGRGDGERVRVNIPLSLVQELLPLIQVDEFDRGKVRIDHLGLDDDFEGVDVRKLWEAIQKVGDAEFLRVQDDDMDLRVVKQGDWLLIQTGEDSKEEIEVRFPLSVVDALFSGEPGELDILAAIEELSRHGGEGDLVRVKDGDSRVRIWIDGRNNED